MLKKAYLNLKLMTSFKILEDIYGLLLMEEVFLDLMGLTLTLLKRKMEYLAI